MEKFNRKIYRERAAHPEKRDVLPDTIKTADKLAMMERFKQSPRSEFRKELKSLARFRKRGASDVITADTGNKVTRWEKNEVAIKVATINRARRREREAIEQLDATIKGKPIGLKRGEMMSERMIPLRPKQFNFENIRGGKEWEKYKELVDRLISPLEKAKRQEMFKENYIKGLENVFGGYADEIIKKIKEIPAEDVLKTFYQEQEATIDFIYSPENLEMKLNVLNDVWSGEKPEESASVSN
ncbi:MAG: hypothetical protein PHS04_13990 [Tissierellia bacterium]|nr:hypothetical protein [Tissierellia bacterium]